MVLKRKTTNMYCIKNWKFPIYQPLPKNLRNTKGDYTLSPSIDDRFWNKMSFDKRPVSNVKKLETTVTLTENNGRNELNFIVYREWKE
jgi:hypothetical protein